MSEPNDDEDPMRPHKPSDDPNDEGCARPDCPAGGGSGVGCVECAEWWDGEERHVR